MRHEMECLIHRYGILDDGHPMHSNCIFGCDYILLVSGLWNGFGYSYVFGCHHLLCRCPISPNRWLVAGGIHIFISYVILFELYQQVGQCDRFRSV